jgi:hypothetical protein
LAGDTINMKIETKINEVKYECEFLLTNADGQQIEFTKSAVREIILIDNIFQVFQAGTVGIANPFDYLETDFLLRGDGRDKFKIMFKAKDAPDSEKYEHEFFIVDDKNSGHQNTREQNIKTYGLLSVDALPFTELAPYGKSYKGYVGDILKEIFVDLLGGGKVDSGNWEAGDFELLEYTVPLGWRYRDVMNDLLHLFYAKDGDTFSKAILQKDKLTNKYTFKLLSTIFQKNKELLMESFAIGDLIDTANTSNPNNPPPDAVTGKYIGTMRNFGCSTPAHEVTNNFFVSRIVHAYDPILGETQIQKIDIKELRDKWKPKYVDVFTAIGGAPKPFIVLNATNEKKFTHVKMPYTIVQNVALAEAELNTAMIFYNLQGSFVNMGDSFRESGKFIDVYKPKDQIIKSDEKLLGRWFVTEVRHIFSIDMYKTLLTFTKTYVGPTSKIADGVQ